MSWVYGSDKASEADLGEEGIFGDKKIEGLSLGTVRFKVASGGRGTSPELGRSREIFADKIDESWAGDGTFGAMPSGVIFSFPFMLLLGIALARVFSDGLSMPGIVVFLMSPDGVLNMEGEKIRDRSSSCIILDVGV